MVCITAFDVDVGTAGYAYVDGIGVGAVVNNNNSNTWSSVSFIVPRNSSYQWSGPTNQLLRWAELR